MNKRLTRSDYLFAFMFIFMLVLAMGTFFYGLKVGKERADLKYQDIIAQYSQPSPELTAYHQQHLVSFYHTVYQPYKQFQKKWFDRLLEIETTPSSDASGIMKELGKLASDKYDELAKKSMPDSSPLLQEGLQNYMRSLKLFSEALRSVQGKANSMRGAELIAELQKDAYLTEAKTFALKAQKDYYGSIVKWNESVNPQFKPIDTSKKIAIKEWNALPINMKDDYLAAMLLAGKQYVPFTPQDLTTRIDEMIVSGQAKKLNYSEVQQIIDVLAATEAVRVGDFLRGKNKYYLSETFPQVPFFYEQD